MNKEAQEALQSFNFRSIMKLKKINDIVPRDNIIKQQRPFRQKRINLTDEDLFRYLTKEIRKLDNHFGIGFFASEVRWSNPFE